MFGVLLQNDTDIYRKQRTKRQGHFLKGSDHLIQDGKATDVFVFHLQCYLDFRTDQQEKDSYLTFLHAQQDVEHL